MIRLPVDDTMQYIFIRGEAYVGAINKPGVPGLYNELGVVVVVEGNLFKKSRFGRSEALQFKRRERTGGEGSFHAIFFLSAHICIHLFKSLDLNQSY